MSARVEDRGNEHDGTSQQVSTTFVYPLDVRFFEVDSLGVVFNMWYLGWCDEAMSAFLEWRGHGYAELRGAGFDAVLRRAEADWLDSLQAFQRAQIQVSVEHVGTTSFRLRYDVRRVSDSATCARIAITYVCVVVADRAKTPIPSGLRAALGAGSSSSAHPGLTPM